ncbi:MAG: hypothetical protein PHO32_08175, partial [Candidatus Cloacimonetes bacterium]|nr:hypothetical protein [Candidatus Cloacimonadota bacterium]
MKLTTYEHDGKVYFRISCYDPRYIPVFKMCYYQEDDSGFYKAYPANYPHIDIIRRNFVQNGEAMFNQLGYFSSIPWEAGLLDFANRVAGKGIDWWLTGSCAVCLRGIKLSPHDVDIMVNSFDIPALMEIFRDDIFEPIVNTEGWVTKDFGVLFCSCRIDIASDPASFVDEPEPVDFGPYAKAH